jgi:hypothetical protein
MPARRKLMSWSAASILAVSILFALANHQPPSARAQDAADDDESEPTEQGTEGTVVVGPQGTARFSRAPADPGAVNYADLSQLEKEATDMAASIMEAEQPPESVAGWSAISHQYAEKAAVRRAEYEAGLSGTSDLGVE